MCFAKKPKLPEIQAPPPRPVPDMAAPPAEEGVSATSKKRPRLSSGNSSFQIASSAVIPGASK